MNRAKHPLYMRHYMIMRKCYDENSKYYPEAGGRGLTVARRWHNMDNFFADIEDQWGLPPSYYAQLARKDPHKGWYPSNIAGWHDHKFVARNRTDNLHITYKGRTQTLAEWSEELGIPAGTIWSRHEKGKTIEECFGIVDGDRRRK
jgi:hypothetical protein